MTYQLINDHEVAKLLSMSMGWVRNQRYRRRHSEDHSFTLDPVLIGKAPRYRLTDVNDWVSNLGLDQ
jgi:hypothetical protein